MSLVLFHLTPAASWDMYQAHIFKMNQIDSCMMYTITFKGLPVQKQIQRFVWLLPLVQKRMCSSCVSFDLPTGKGGHMDQWLQVQKINLKSNFFLDSTQSNAWNLHILNTKEKKRNCTVCCHFWLWVQRWGSNQSNSSFGLLNSFSLSLSFFLSFYIFIFL